MIDAVDIWGYAEQGYEICFPALGELLFLDAATSPRQVTTLPARYDDGMTCTSVDRPGTVVLVSASADIFAGDGEPTVALKGCQLTTNYILNLRDAPGGERVLDLIPYQTRLTAAARVSNWFQVTHLGVTGWISAGHVRTRGHCG